MKLEYTMVLREALSLLEQCDPHPPNTCSDRTTCPFCKLNKRREKFIKRLKLMLDLEA